MKHKYYIGVYIPSEEEVIECVENGKSCEYGICSECYVGAEKDKEE